jgi:superfamily II DNA or RNA helicase
MTADPLLGPPPLGRSDGAVAAERSLARLTDAMTHRRAMQSAQDGAVVDYALLDGGERLKGRVRGSRGTVYVCVVRFTRAPSGIVTAVSGACSCPVVSNCTHVFALLLTAFGAGGASTSDPEVATTLSAAPWKRALAPLLRDDRPATTAAPTQLGLQVELLPIGSPTAAISRTPRVRVGLRPVLLGARGQWIRTGISWDRLAAHGHQRQPPPAEQVQLLREIKFLDAVSRPTHHYGRTDTFIYLDEVGSPHIWDLLALAADVGVAIVQSGQGQRPVTVSGGPAEISLDVCRVGGSLILEPNVTVNGEPVGPVHFALLGSPLHGLALWPMRAGSDDRGADVAVAGLTLIRSQQRLSAELRNVLAEEAIEIPQPDEDVFLRDFLPRLARRVPLVSRDRSVTIPLPQRPALCLDVKGLPGHRVSLQWHWQYRTGERANDLSLWPSPSDDVARDDEAERAALASLALTRDEVAQLTTIGPAGPRLLPTATLAGLDAVSFFGQTLPRLRELSGLLVTVENELTFRLADGAPLVEISTTARATGHDWFDLGVAVSIDGETVPFNALFVALGRGEAQMFLPSGTYFPLNREPFLTLRRLIEEARALEDVPGRTVKLNRYQAALWQELDDIGVVTEQAAAWERSVGGLLAGEQIVDRAVPAGLRATLRPYQQAGFHWLAFLYEHGLGGVLADDMGLGKTVQTLALVCHAREQRPQGPPFLVVAPTSVVGNWAAECRRFAPDLRTVVLSETLNRSGKSLPEVIANADLVITSYALFRLDNDRYAQLPWSGLILDEAQFIKNHLSKGYQCAKKLATPFKLAITGTPMENNLLELWSLFSVTCPGLFAHAGRFREYYQGPIEKDGNSDRLAQLRRRIRPLMLRRTKEQVVGDLPAKLEQVIELELNPQHRKVYQQHLQRERQKVLGLIDDLQKNRFVIFRSLTLLRQLSLDAALVDEKYAKIPSTKLDALMLQITDVVAEGHRTLIFSQFTGFLEKVRDHLDAAGIEHCYLDGRTKNRPAVLAQFTTGSAPIFLISLKAGGVGLNLTAADYCILLDPWWNPATEAQAVDRVHRIGQTRKVMVYRLVAKDTIEEKVMALKATKAKLFSSVMDAGSAQSAALTAGDIRELLS